MNCVNKLVLGTVQFGLDYGINNHSGQVNEEEVGRILKLANESGINSLDTSSAYGNSEAVLGKSLLENQLRFRIISKYPQSEDGVTTVFASSLENCIRRGCMVILCIILSFINLILSCGKK